MLKFILNVAELSRNVIVLRDLQPTSNSSTRIESIYYILTSNRIKNTWIEIPTFYLHDYFYRIPLARITGGLLNEDFFLSLYFGR